MPRKIMDVKECGDYYELKREQWKGKFAKITKDPTLLEEVSKFTWTCTNDQHPYLYNSKTGSSLHKFVLCYIYGKNNVDEMLSAHNIIEHLDNDGLNCTYENLHILSEDWNKAKAFTIDKLTEDIDEYRDIPPYVTDVYYKHAEKSFQMQIFLNDGIYKNITTGNFVAMFVCSYNDFKNLYLDWIYVLTSINNRFFDISKFHADQILGEDCPIFKLKPEEQDSPVIVRDGVCYLNLDAKKFGRNSYGFYESHFNAENKRYKK